MIYKYYNIYLSVLGEEADRLSGLSGPRDDMNSLSESVYQSREHISNILERCILLYIMCMSCDMSCDM